MTSSLCASIFECDSTNSTRSSLMTRSMMIQLSDKVDSTNTTNYSKFIVLYLSFMSIVIVYKIIISQLSICVKEKIISRRLHDLWKLITRQIICRLWCVRMRFCNLLIDARLICLRSLDLSAFEKCRQSRKFFISNIIIHKTFDSSNFLSILTIKSFFQSPVIQRSL